MKSIVTGLFLLGSLGGGTAWYFTASGSEGSANQVSGGAAAQVANGLHTVTRGRLEILLVEDGTLVAKNARKVVMKARRGGKITTLVEEGKVVTEGEVLVKFDTTDLVQRIEQLELDQVQGDANLKSAETELDIQKADNISALAKAKILVERVTLELERYQGGDAPMERRKLQVEIKDAQTRFRRAKKRYEDSKRLIAQKYIKQADLETDRIAFEKAEVEKEGAELALALFKKYTFKMTMREKVTKISDAKRDLETATKRATSRLLQKEVKLAQNKKRLARVRRSLKQLKEDLAGMILKSPCPGIVIYGDPKGHSWFRQQVKVGGHIWGGNTIMTIPDLRVMQVKVSIHEADINKVKTEQKVTITMDTYSGLVLHGKVTRIAAIASMPPGSNHQKSEVKKFDVEITIDDTAKKELKPGISAKATILIDTREEALSVPIQCVFLDNGTHYAYVKEADGPARREVKVGLSGEHYIEILDGLSEGEQVLLYNPNLPQASKAEEEEAKKTGTEAETSTSPGAKTE